MSTGYVQLVTPDPGIPCRPGYCLEYVRETFGAPLVEPTADAGWLQAAYQHPDMDFPEGMWVPLWFDVQGVPAGHVVLRAPDGSIYSTTDPGGTTAHHHPSLADLMAAYAPWYPLTYRGWTEDISRVRVTQPATITPDSIEEDMPLSRDDINAIASAVVSFNVNQEGPGKDGQLNLGGMLAWYNANNDAIVNGVNSTTARLLATLPVPDLAAQLNAAGIAREVYAELGKLFTTPTP